MRQQRNQNITLSLSQDVIADLHQFIKKRGISQFVEEAIVERLKDKKSALEQQYIEAAQDEARNKAAAEWDHLASEGLDDSNSW